VLLMCGVLKVSQSAYYAYGTRTSYLKSEAGLELSAKVKEIYLNHRRRYGARRISAELKAEGLKIGRRRVRTLMAGQGLKAIQPRRFVPRTTISDNTKASPNLLKGVTISKPRAALVGDITYLPITNGKWCYLASWQDKVSKRVVGWKVSARMTDDLVIGALEKAIVRGAVNKGAIIHSDRGSQYSSRDFRKLLKKHTLKQSMSGKGNCYDNAQAESFWARFKIELLENGIFQSVEDARSEAFSYIEGYYNRIRRHSALGYRSPEQFEIEFPTA
jgi:putative transposase